MKLGSGQTYSNSDFWFMPNNYSVSAQLVRIKYVTGGPSCQVDVSAGQVALTKGKFTFIWSAFASFIAYVNEITLDWISGGGVQKKGRNGEREKGRGGGGGERVVRGVRFTLVRFDFYVYDDIGQVAFFPVADFTAAGCRYYDQVIAAIGELQPAVSIFQSSLSGPDIGYITFESYGDLQNYAESGLALTLVNFPTGSALLVALGNTSGTVIEISHGE